MEPTSDDDLSGGPTVITEPIFSLACDCDDLIHECLARPLNHGPLKDILDDYERRFNAWWRYLGVFANPEANLDRRLQPHPEIRDIVVRLLLILKKYLTQLKEHWHEFSHTEHTLLKSKDDSTSSDSQSSTALTLQAIHESLSELSQVGAAIRQSSTTPETIRARKFIRSSRSRELDQISFEKLCLISLGSLYPNAPRSLLIQLGKSMVDRRARLLLRKSRQETLGHDIRHHVVEPEAVELSATSPTADSNTPAPATQKPRIAFRPSTGHNLEPPMAATSIHPSAFGKQRRPALRDAPKHGTTMVLASKNAPPVPTFEEGKETICQWCFKSIGEDLVAMGGWSGLGTAHYLGDLEPFPCISEACAEAIPTFRSAEDWRRHMSQHSSTWSQNVHLQPIWRCELGGVDPDETEPESPDLEHPHSKDTKHWSLDTVFWTRGLFCAHVKTHHHAISDTTDEAAVEVLVERAFDDTPRKLNICPLCYLIPKGLGTVDGSSVTVTRSMGDHVTEHLQNIMVLSLQLIEAHTQHQNDQATEGTGSSIIPDDQERTIPIHSKADLEVAELEDLASSSPILIPESSGDASEATSILSPITGAGVQDWSNILEKKQEQYGDTNGFSDPILKDLRRKNWFEDLYSRAKSTVSAERRIIIRQSTPTTVSAGQAALKSCSTAAAERLRACEDQNWTFRFLDRMVQLHSQAMFVTNFLDKLISLGDGVAYTGSIYPAMPWLGLQHLLENPSIPSDPSRLGPLLTGAELALYTFCRLQVYTQYLYELPESQEKSNLESLVVGSHGYVLSFLAYGIGKSHENALKTWSDSELEVLQVSSQTHWDDIEQYYRYLEESDYLQHGALAHDLRELEYLRMPPETAWLKLDETELHSILDWTSQVPYRHHHELSHVRIPGTGDWIFTDEAYCAWEEDASSSDMLWLHGFIGTGKTTLIAHIIESRRQSISRSDGLAYVYCRLYDGPSDANSVICCLLRQFATSTSDDDFAIHGALVETYRKSHSQGLSSGQILNQQAEDVLTAIIRTFETATIFLDGLDQCSDADQIDLIALFRRLMTVKPGVKILISSRGNTTFGGKSGNEVKIQIDSSKNRADVEKFVISSVDRDEMVRGRPFSRSLRQEILEKLTTNHGGMFLWVQLQIDQLLQLETEDDIRHQLQTLPRGLAHVYDETWKRIRRQSGSRPEIASRALQWTLSCPSPLQAEVLVAAVCQVPGASGPQPIDDIDIDFVTSSCQNLIEVDESGTVRFGHESVREYFKQEHAALIKEGLVSTATICLQLLSHETSFRLTNVREDRWRDGKYATLPEFSDQPVARLVDYARGYWPRSYAAAQDLMDTNLDNQLAQFLGESYTSASYRMWHDISTQTVNMLDSLPQSVSLYQLGQLEPSTNPLLPICLFGFHRLLVQSLIDINLVNKRGMTLLAVACVPGNSEIVRLLLEARADVNSKDDYNGQTPLWYAAANGHEGTVKLLLEAGADVDPKDYHDRTPLSHAAEDSHKGAVKLLLEAGADVNLKDDESLTPLSYAAEYGCAGTVELLLKAGADVDSKGSFGQTPLSYTAANGRERTVKLLLEAEADVDSKDSGGRTPLWYAAANGHEGIVKLLLEAGADVDSKDDSGRTPLSYAAEYRHEETVKLLLEAGADVNSKDDKSRTPLSYAAGDGYEGIAKLLLEAGANIDSEDSSDRAPLSDAALEHEDGHSKSRLKLPKLPKWLKSSKSTKSPSLCKTEQNHDYLDQCAGCNNVEILIRRSIEQGKIGLEKVPVAILHNSLDELDQCARKCQICRVFRQALILEEVTFDGVKALQNTPGEVMVRWEETTAADGRPRVFLQVELNGQPGWNGVVNCNSQNNIGHLALSSNGLNSAVIEQAKGWLDTCRNTHVGWCDNLRWSNENPQLLVEVLSPSSVRLRENQEVEYVALSYCWGNMQTLSQAERDEVERGKTLLANLDRRRQPFPMSHVPATVRDALLIIHAMGIRFAWVDLLCIVQDSPEGWETLHKVYSNALFTLCACATSRATAKLLDQREAWTQRTEPCRLGGQWLTTPDMSLNELRLRSPLAEYAWTLQEERLSPRILYVSSSRMYWSCARGHEMEMKPTYGNVATALHRPVYASDRYAQIPAAQDFLLACHSGSSNLHAYWEDIVQSYALRRMSNLSDRFAALSSLAGKYLSASRGDEYLTGLWANDLAEGLAWRVHQVIETYGEEEHPEIVSSPWPSWSWGVVPPQTAIGWNAKSERSSFFERVVEDSNETSEAHSSAADAVRRGEQVKEVCVTGRTRIFWGPSSRVCDWKSVCRLVDGKERFSFAAYPEEDLHAVEAESGRVLVYEDRRREVVGQLDFRRDLKSVLLGQVDLWALELGVSTMLLLEQCGEGRWRRVGVAWHVRDDFFASAQCETLILQ